MSTPRRSEWRDLLGSFVGATWDLVQLRELRHRTDSKFVLSPRVAAQLLAGLTRSYAVLPTGSELLSSYRTLYFDTPQLNLFHSHRRGRRVRHKVRIRHYPDRHVSQLEVKTRRSDLETIKHWRERTYGDSELTMDDQLFVGSHTGIAQPVFPQAWTYFHRVTLLGIETGERITLDLDLRVEWGDRVRVLDGIAIVEIKQWPFCRSTPVMDALRRAGQRPGWASKYCSAIVFTHPDVPANELLPGLRALERGAA